MYDHRQTPIRCLSDTGNIQRVSGRWYVLRPSSRPTNQVRKLLTYRWLVTSDIQCGVSLVLQALCAEASLAALRRVYPQIYASDVKLLIDPSAVRVTRQDFVTAMKGEPGWHPQGRGLPRAPSWQAGSCPAITVLYCTEVCLNPTLT